MRDRRPQGNPLADLLLAQAPVLSAFSSGTGDTPPAPWRVVGLPFTSRAEADDRLQGLDIGADDYVCKPFLAGELAARLRALLRRSGNWRAAPTPPAPVLSIDVAAMQASIRGVTLALTPVEFRLLQTLAQHEGRVYSRAQLLDAIYASSHVINDRTVDSHIKNLRRKIVDAGGDDPLLPVYGVGYKFQWPKQR